MKSVFHIRRKWTEKWNNHKIKNISDIIFKTVSGTFVHKRNGRTIFSDKSLEFEVFDALVQQGLVQQTERILSWKTYLFQQMYLQVHRIILVPFSFIKIVFEAGIVLKRLDLIEKHHILYLNMLISKRKWRVWGCSLRNKLIHHHHIHHQSSSSCVQFSIKFFQTALCLHQKD